MPLTNWPTLGIQAMHTSRPNVWNILSEVPSGFVKKYLARRISSEREYRIFFSGG